jgi:hypothetical protein
MPALQRGFDVTIDQLMTRARYRVDAGVQRLGEALITPPSPASDASAFSRMGAFST